MVLSVKAVSETDHINYTVSAATQELTTQIVCTCDTITTPRLLRLPAAYQDFKCFRTPHFFGTDEYKRVGISTVPLSKHKNTRKTILLVLFVVMLVAHDHEDIKR